jgi:protein-disulfide isomerase
MNRGYLISGLISFISVISFANGANALSAMGSSSAGNASPVRTVLTGEQKGQLLIENLSHHFAKVVQHFDAPGGLIGYVVQPIGKKRGSIIYTDQAGEYLFAGNIINAQGENVTQQETSKYIDAPLMDQMYRDVAQLNFFTQGKDTAPHKLYIVFDPNCSICHMVFGMLQPLIDSESLQVRWIPVGIMQASSVGKSAAIMMGKDDAARVVLLKQDENSFDMKTESGGIPELKKPVLGSTSAASSPKTPQEINQEKAQQTAFDLVAKNNQFFSDYGFNGTPVFFLKYQTGEKKYFPGFYQGTWLTDEVHKTGDSWT